MKRLCDKIILLFFYFFCIFSFIAGVIMLPTIIQDVFEIKLSPNINVLSFFFCTAITIYSYNYYFNKKSDEQHDKNILDIAKLNVVNNINHFDYSSLNIIYSITYEIVSGLNIELKNQYNFNIDIADFIHITEQEDLIELDSYINSCLNDLLHENKEKVLIQLILQQKVKKYLQELKEFSV